MAAKLKKSEVELKTLVAQAISNAVDYDRRENAGKREKAVRFFLGDLAQEVPAQPHRSAVISRDVSDTIGWILPGIMRVFLASGRMVDFEPRDREDEDYFEEASDHCNHIFMKENDGYQIVYNACHDALLHGNGIIKVWCEEVEESRTRYLNAPDETAMALAVDGDEIDAISEMEGGYEAKVSKRRKVKRIMIDVIEREDFLIDSRAVNIKDAQFTAHREEITKSDLIKRGFDKKKVSELPAFSTRDYDLVDQARTADNLSHDDALEEANKTVELFECYVQSDVDGDGQTELVQVFYAGSGGAGVILDWRVWEDERVFYDIKCEPVPHRFEALSIFDHVGEEQKVKTVLRRQLLDNLYQVNNPRPEIVQGEVVNMEALTSPKYGQPIIKRANGNPITWHTIPFIGDKAMMGLEYADQVIERRTGVSRSTMALDPEALQNQTATAVQASRDSAYSKIELIARNMAQGWADVFGCILKLAHKHYSDETRSIRVNNKWRDGRPGNWNPEMSAIINTGLGAGSRDRDMAMLSMVNQGQQALAAALAQYGLTEKALQLLPMIRETSVKIAESAGLRNADSYYPDFPEQELAGYAQMMRNQPDPAAEAQQQKMQMEMAKSQAGMQAKAQQAQMDAQIKRENNRMEIDLEREQILREIALKREQLDAELRLKREQLEAELALKVDMGGSADIGNVRVGGDAG